MRRTDGNSISVCSRLNNGRSVLMGSFADSTLGIVSIETEFLHQNRLRGLEFPLSIVTSSAFVLILIEWSHRCFANQFSITLTLFGMHCSYDTEKRDTGANLSFQLRHRRHFVGEPFFKSVERKLMNFSLVSLQVCSPGMHPTPMSTWRRN